MKNILIIALFLIVSAVYSQTNPCVNYHNYKIVILGSSTAAGTGVSTPDSAWVNRYRRYLQSINPNNEVINLAQGGYHTYKIMPTNYTPPTGRPSPDTTRNIDAAIAQNPDAIIINLPSNDVSLGYSVAEQLFNFDTVRQIAHNHNIPIWICTTQPKNFSDSLLRQIQENLKDSINLLFAPHTIDFWSIVATYDNYIDSIYDSGDGTHLNDTAHRLLCNQVINSWILDTIYNPSTFIDYELNNINRNYATVCGDLNESFKIKVANIGAPDLTSTKVYIEVINLNNNTTFTDSAIINSISSCMSDSVTFTGNTSLQGNYKVKAYIYNYNDTTNNNDTLDLYFTTQGHPTLSVKGDTICGGGTATYSAIFNSIDTVYWYNNLSDTVPIAYGNKYISSYLTSTDTMYAEAIRGDLYYKNDLFTTLSSNVDWNGTMFNIVSSQDIVIDNFDVKINSLGWQGVKIYYKQGSYISHELNIGAWTLLDTANVNVNNSDDFTNVPIGNLQVSANDTMGIYISLDDSNSDLSYRYVTLPVVRQNQELTIITGSGISYNFSNSYYPRDWNGTIYYHYGHRPNGDCSTGKIMARALVSKKAINLGNDTIIDINDTLNLSTNPNMTYYTWSNGSSDSTLQIIANNLGMGIHFISIDVTDTLQCVFSDTIIIGVADLNNISDADLISNIKIYPNPASTYLQVESENLKVKSCAIYNIDGRNLTETNPVRFLKSNKVDISNLPKGIYFIKLQTEKGQIVSKFIKE